MVLAAGLGTRLRPFTDSRPKALMEVAGRTLLEITLTRLHGSGVSEAIVNVHHFADMVVDYLKAKNNFGMRIEISREDDLLLDTGGGLKKAAWFFLQNARANAPFILHNVDVISNIDLAKMVQVHTQNGALATLAVQRRESSRQLLFDDALQLCGRKAARDQSPNLIRPVQNFRQMAFAGIHVISPRLLPMIQEDGVFSIIDVYLRLAAQGEKIMAFSADGSYWRDLGRTGDLKQAAEDLNRGTLR
jgi:mannose-1-phosphate guanylyltransferase